MAFVSMWMKRWIKASPLLRPSARALKVYIMDQTGTLGPHLLPLHSTLRLTISLSTCVDDSIHNKTRQALPQSPSLRLHDSHQRRTHGFSVVQLVGGLYFVSGIFTLNFLVPFIEMMPNGHDEGPNSRLPDGQTETVATTTNSKYEITLRVMQVAESYGMENIWIIRHEAWIWRANRLMNYYSDDANEVAEQLNREFCRHYATNAGEVTAVLEMLKSGVSCLFAMYWNE